MLFRSDLNGVFWQVFRAADRYSFYILNPAGSWNSSYTNLSPSGTVQAYERTTPYGGYLYWSAGANTTSYAVIIYNDTDSTNSGEYITSNTYFYFNNSILSLIKDKSYRAVITPRNGTVRGRTYTIRNGAIAAVGGNQPSFNIDSPIVSSAPTVTQSSEIGRAHV